MPVKKAFGAHRSDKYNGRDGHDPLQTHGYRLVVYKGPLDRETVLYFCLDFSLDQSSFGTGVWSICKNA